MNKCNEVSSVRIRWSSLQNTAMYIILLSTVLGVTRYISNSLRNIITFVVTK